MLLPHCADTKQSSTRILSNALIGADAAVGEWGDTNWTLDRVIAFVAGVAAKCGVDRHCGICEAQWNHEVRVKMSHCRYVLGCHSLSRGLRHSY